ncbi:MAG: sugar phosphate nucleotidyltransferase [Actinomycetota bacterium]|jgi:glucose-1-phosphate adenylyltransferase|nr:sugar phosphate nucleotidyltransferase [Actinomycetota bacterium]
MKRDVIAYVLGGGAGKRLYPLTRDRTKPAVPFGGSYRVIDFVLSNFLNSKVEKIYIVTQYEPRSLEEHIMRAWTPLFGMGKHRCVRLLPPRKGDDTGWYAGTADAVFQNRRFIEEDAADIVNVFCGDHIYLMDISQMNDFHMFKKADLTISAIPVKTELAAGRYGVLVVDEQWKLLRFEEKPEKPTNIPGMPGYCLASMGNYAFDPQVLLDGLIHLSRIKFKDDPLTKHGSRFSSLDFGFDVIPQMLKSRRKIYVYNFNLNKIPGSRPNRQGYWRDIGDLDQFYTANMELIGEDPPFELNNNEWEIFTKADSQQAPKIVGQSCFNNSIISNGSFLYNCKVENSILAYNSRIEPKTTIQDSILLGLNQIGRKVVINKAIIDKGVNIPDGEEIGVDRLKDKSRGFFISPQGITVVPRKYEFYPGEEKLAI